jgi:hypothetical protein
LKKSKKENPHQNTNSLDGPLLLKSQWTHIYHLALLICSTKDFTTMAIHLASAEFLQLGLLLAGFEEGHQQRTCAETNL